MRYYTCQGRYGADFDPATYRPRSEYDPDEVIAKFYVGFLRRKVKDFIEPVYGSGPDVLDLILRDNPADLLTSTNLQPGELQIYVNYGAKDNYNFDAQALSFVWLAGLRGVAVEVTEVPRGRHNLPYFESQEPVAFRWLTQHLLPPVRAVTEDGRCVSVVRTALARSSYAASHPLACCFLPRWSPWAQLSPPTPLGGMKW